MAQVTISAQNYDTFASVPEADLYLAADAALATGWAGRTADQKARALVSATRGLARAQWEGDAPTTAAPPPEVRDACSVFAALIAAKPELSGKPGTQSNIARVKAGSAEVEFRAQEKSETRPYPDQVYAILFAAGLLGSASAVSAPYIPGVDEPSYFSGNPWESSWPEWIE